ncbi:MAG: phosphomannomutase [Parcubacteria bacterium C7867-006]|nr:MAG: phosphomannomutase [Parcubacteria bacterium C7867-006]
MNTKKVIACDLDGTLAPSKSSLSREMSDVIRQILPRYSLAVISGGAFPQFQKQFLFNLDCPKELYKNLYLFPTMGSTCYVYDYEKDDWKQIYEEKLSDEERRDIIQAFKDSINESGLDLEGAYGEILEDRGTQVTFSGRGQNAPIDAKNSWDPDRTKRQILVDLLKSKIPNFDIRMGGMSSIDVTRLGVDKAYAIGKIKSLLNVNDDDIVFVGDALYKGGNDAPVKKTNVDYIQEDGPNETLELLKNYI